MPTERLTKSHLPQALALSAEAGWNQTAADWAIFIDHGTLFGELIDERLVATAAALPYGADFGWISMVLTTSTHRGRGIARALTALATATLRDTGRTAFLDATPAGAAVYAKLGFVPLCAMQRWQGAGSGIARAHHTPNLSHDTPAFGADRSFLLRNFLSRPGTRSFATETSFALVRDGAIASQIGPVIGTHSEAQALTSAAIRSASGRVFIDVLQAGYPLLATLTRENFTEQRAFTRMALGRPILPGDPKKLLVAASPEFG